MKMFNVMHEQIQGMPGGEKRFMTHASELVQNLEIMSSI